MNDTCDQESFFFLQLSIDMYSALELGVFTTYASVWSILPQELLIWQESI